MRIVVAKCSVTYEGRGNTTLPAAVRAILIKADGAVSIHADTNGNKPLNYMAAGNTHSETKVGRKKIWLFQTRKEKIEITISKVLSDVSFDLDGVEPGLARKNTEKDIQAWLANNLQVFSLNMELVRREFPTGAGAVDILAVDHVNKILYPIEIKRIAMLGAVDQCRRYRSALDNEIASGNIFDDSYSIQPIIAALDVRPNTLALAEKHDIVSFVLADAYLSENK